MKVPKIPNPEGLVALAAVDSPWPIGSPSPRGHGGPLTLAQRQRGRNVEAVFADLNPVIRGGSNSVGVAEASGVHDQLDRWVRMRLSSFRFQRRCRRDNCLAIDGLDISPGA